MNLEIKSADLIVGFSCRFLTTAVHGLARSVSDEREASCPARCPVGGRGRSVPILLLSAGRRAASSESMERSTGQWGVQPVSQ